MDGYYAWMLVATSLVLMMTTPALALFYGGMSRSKSVLNMMMMSFGAMARRRHRLRAVGLVGCPSPAPTSATLFANPFTPSASKGVELRQLRRASAFQLTFAVITAALISGAIADRVKFSAWMVFLRSGSRSATSRWPTWCGAAASSGSTRRPVRRLFGSPTASQRLPQDYAGGTVVHINAGVAGLVLALLIGRRVGFGKEPMRPHNLTADDDRRRPAVVRLVRLQRRLDRLRRRRRRREGHRPVHVRDRRHLHEHHARHLRRDARLARSWSGSCTARPPRWAPPPASSRAWSPSPRPAARSTSRRHRHRRRGGCGRAPARSA